MASEAGDEEVSRPTPPKGKGKSKAKKNGLYCKIPCRMNSLISFIDDLALNANGKRVRILLVDMLLVFMLKSLIDRISVRVSC